MKLIAYSVLALLLLISLSAAHAVETTMASAETVAIVEKLGGVSIGNNLVRVEINLTNADYNIVDVRDGTVVIANAHGEVDGIGGSPRPIFSNRQPDPKAKLTWTVRDIADKLGKGKTLNLNVRRTDDREFFTTVTVRNGKGFVALGSGMVNRRSYPVRVMSFQPLVGGRVFPGLEMKDARTLNGAAGSAYTAVQDGTDRACANSLLLTFTAKGQRHSLVLGGLSYHDYAKYAALGEYELWDGSSYANFRGDNSKLGQTWKTVWKKLTAPKNQNDKLPVTAQVAAIDPVGRLVDAGATYEPDDLFYVDVTTADPFLALEGYGMALRTATQAHPNIYNNLTICGWFSHRNTSAMLVEEMVTAKKLDMLKTIPVTVRLEPDTYCGVDNGNTEQGWWDDAHWQKYGHLVPPYDTFKKFIAAVHEGGGNVETYFQCGMPSDDFAEAFPGYMINNDISRLHRNHTHIDPMETYDPTDIGFQKHMAQVWARLKEAGLSGVKFDYPNIAWDTGGGFEDPYATTASAYRKWFQMCRDGLGSKALIHERALGEEPLDVTAGIVDMQRTWYDSDRWFGDMAARGGLRWYKNRVVMSYYPDSKSFIFFDENGSGHPDQPMAPLQRRAIITMLYVTSGRIESARSLQTLTPEVVHDLSRAFPMHSTPQSARPVDAFTGHGMPKVYSFRIDDQWQQLTFYNDDKSVATISAPFSGEQASTGSLGLNPSKRYYVYEFWSDRLVGKMPGTATLSEQLAAGEARMYSVREVLDHPQVLSTDRHLMQGYVDLADVKWDAAAKQLSGVAKVIGGEPFRITIANNGGKPVSMNASGAIALIEKKPAGDLSVIVLERTDNGDCHWQINY